MIRQSPEVPAAVELADLSKHIMRTEFTFEDQASQGALCWQSPIDYNPYLKVMIPLTDRIEYSRGYYVIKMAHLAILEDSSEYWLHLPMRIADRIVDDPYIEDFVEAFRQYPHSRGELLPPT